MAEITAFVEKLYVDFEKAQTRVQELEVQIASLKGELLEIIAHAYGADVANDLKSNEEVLGALWNLCDIISARDKTIAEHNALISKYRERLEFFRKLFACPRCGTVDGLDLSEAWQRYIRDALAKAGWGHTSCKGLQK